MASSDPSTSEPSPESNTTASRSLQRSFSCVVCAQRKVRCDRHPGGCANCTKARVSCVYKAPPPARRRKKGEREIDITARLRLYEEALRQLGFDPDDVVKRKLEKEPANQAVSGINGLLQHREIHHPTDVGVLVSSAGKSRYLENGIWTSLQSEFRDPQEILDDSSDEDPAGTQESILPQHYTINGTDLLFGTPISQSALRSLHPEPVQIFKLWQTYLDNINPLVKLFHAPTVQQLISDASGDLADVPRNLEALLFGIYCISVESLADGECVSILGISKSAAVQRFRAGAQFALINASLMKTSDVMVLQAFVLFILSLQNFDARIIWVWSGITQRLAQRIGLHRDGAKLGLSPLEVEIRRRMWWQIMMLEGYSQKLAGTGTNGAIFVGDVRMPSNVNDSDLFPGMKEEPKAHQGATEMMFFLIRCHAAEFLRRSADTKSNYDGAWNRITTSAVPLAIKERAIKELEDLYQHQFLQHCDPSIPWHYMCAQLGKAIILNMRFMSRSASHHIMDVAPAEKDMLFNLALQITAAQNVAYTTKEMQGFMWHVNTHFQWKSFVFLISELRQRTEGEYAEQAWTEVQKSFDFHPSFDRELAKRALPIAVSNLTLKAWEAYAAAKGTSTPEPYFIQLIRQRRNVTKHTQAYKPRARADAVQAGATQNVENHGDVGNYVQQSADMFESCAFNFAGFDHSVDMLGTLPETISLDLPENLDWTAWDHLFVDAQTNGMDEVPTNLANMMATGHA